MIGISVGWSLLTLGNSLCIPGGTTANMIHTESPQYPDFCPFHCNDKCKGILQKISDFHYTVKSILQNKLLPEISISVQWFSQSDCAFYITLTE